MRFFDHVRICDWVRRGEIDWGFWALFYVLKSLRHWRPLQMWAMLGSQISRCESMMIKDDSNGQSGSRVDRIAFQFFVLS